ncbi:MAG: hypothetical protein ACTSP4_01335 [Candidatus Hodarchaeales archaeon]
MAETALEVYIKLGQMVIITFLVIVLIIRQRQTRIRPLYWLVVIFLLADLQGLVELVIYYVKTSILHLEETNLFRFNEFHTIPYSMGIFAVYLLAEYMTGKRPNEFRFFIVTGLWIAFLTTMLYDAFFEVEEGPVNTHSFNTIFNIFQCTAMLYVVYVFLGAFIKTKNKSNKNISFLIFLATATFEIVALYDILQDSFGFPRIYAALPYSMTFLILAYVYFRHPYYVFNVPTKIYRVFIANKDTGGLLYSAEMDSVDYQGDNLFAPAVTAMSMLMKEVAGTTKNLLQVTFTNREMMVSRRGKIVGYILSDEATLILGLALKHYVKEFSALYSEELEKMERVLVGKESFKGSEELLARCFPFLEAKDVIRTRIFSSKT